MKEIIRDRAIELIDKDLSIIEIHKNLYEGYLSNAGELRKENVYEDGFVFEQASFLKDTLKYAERLPERTYEDIINKYIELTIAHPFVEGNDFVLRLWLDMTLKKNLKVVIDWSQIKKEDFASSLKRSAINPDILSMLLEGALTKELDDKELLFRSVESSLSYE